MKRIVTLIVAAGLLASVAVAEESGVFVGAGVIAGGATLGGTNTSGATTNSFTFGIVAGYKQFFNDSFGLRYYANFDYSYTINDNTTVDTVQGYTELTGDSQYLLNYGVNVDALYNFANSGDSSFGAFLGLGLGANTLGGKSIDTLKETAKAAGISVKTTGFDVHLNVGLRGVFAKSHAIELGVKVPFMPIEMYKEGDSKLTYKQNYSVAMRYTYSF